jgi:hypothetical protein
MPQQQGKQGGQQSGPPSNEQLTQFLMVAKGLNREAAALEIATNADEVKQQFQKVKQLVESGGDGGGGKEDDKSEKSGGQQGQQGQQQHGGQDKEKDKK